jgi:hypothetical protein
MGCSQQDLQQAGSRVARPMSCVDDRQRLRSPPHGFHAASEGRLQGSTLECNPR